MLERLGQIAWQGEGLAAQATAAEIDPTGTHLFVQTYTQGQRIKLELIRAVFLGRCMSLLLLDELIPSGNKLQTSYQLSACR